VSILAFGGEMGFFLPSDNSCNEVVNDYDSSFARCTARSTSAAGYLQTPAVSAQANFWLHYEGSINGYSLSSSAVQSVTFLDSGGIEQIRVTVTYQSPSTWTVDKWNGSSWTTLKSITVAQFTRQVVDVHIVSNTASGSIDLYVAGTKRLSTGTIDLSTLTGITQCRMYGNDPGFAGAYQDYSQVVMASETTIGMRVGTIYMSGQGATHTFDTGGYTNIDEAVYSDADFIQSGTAGQIELFTGTAIPTFTSYSIRAVALTARAKTDGSPPAHFRFQLRSGGVVYDNGADLALDFGYGNFCAVWETDPATGSAFANTAISTLQFGVKSVT
jgi:hypothetical protein